MTPCFCQFWPRDVSVKKRAEVNRPVTKPWIVLFSANGCNSSLVIWVKPNNERPSSFCCCGSAHCSCQFLNLSIGSNLANSNGYESEYFPVLDNKFRHGVKNISHALVRFPFPPSVFGVMKCAALSHDRVWVWVGEEEENQEMCTEKEIEYRSRRRSKRRMQQNWKSGAIGEWDRRTDKKTPK